MENNENDLTETAKKAREKAHAPFSNFKVGAAVRTKSGKIFTGCNIENASYSSDDLRRTRRDFQSDQRRRNGICGNRRRCRHARTHAAVRTLPPNHLGILRRYSCYYGESQRQYRNRSNERTSAESFRY